jgi:Zn-dependent protease with chaperone function
MLIGTTAITLNSVFIAASVFFYCVIALSFVVYASEEWRVKLSAGARQWVLWSVVLIPWLVALSVTTLVLKPNFVAAMPSWFRTLSHWHHINVFNLYSWHTLLVILFAGISLNAIVCHARQLFSHRSTLNKLLSLDALTKGENVSSTVIYALTAGLIKPKIFISPALRETLTDAENEIVARHEFAHQQRLDPLRKLCFYFLTAFYLPFIGKQLRREFSLCLELAADDYAAAGGFGGSSVASTVIKLCRLSRDQHHFASPLPCHFYASEIEARVHYQLRPERGRGFPLSLFAVLLAVLLASCLLSVDSYHHAVEAIFSH